MSKNVSSGKIGRFEIDSVLGSGAQGTVFRALDPRLDRYVAIKTLKINGRDATERAHHTRSLLDESRIVSQLSHPNIIALFDAGEDKGIPYLVFEFVEGQVLANKLRSVRQLPIADAINIVIQILKATGYAHSKGILHRDLKPANIMLTVEGDARVMDFGIAQFVATGTEVNTSFCGTPAYMAPEYASGAVFTERADVFSIGMVLYELLTGATAITSANHFEVLHRMATEPFAAPSTRNAEINARLDGVVMKAISKKPEERFENTNEMENALRSYIQPQVDVGANSNPSAGGTLDFLLRRMRARSDFPAMSATIAAITRTAHDEKRGVTALTEVILKDFALTNKLLKLVNTASYGQYGGRITTVSRAVTVLGFSRVRAVSAALLLLDHLKNKAQAEQLRELLVSTYFGGMLARTFAGITGVDREEAFVCALFHDLGRMLVRFYLSDESDEMELVMTRDGVDEKRAATRVLGIGLDALGIGVVESWNFPESIVRSMRHIDSPVVRLPTDAHEKLRITAAFASSSCGMLRQADVAAQRRQLRTLNSRYAPAFRLSEEQFLSIVNATLDTTQDDETFAELISARNSAFIDNVRRICSTEDDAGTPNAARSANSDNQNRASPLKSDRNARLSSGIQEITNAMVDGSGVNDVLLLALDVAHKGMGFSRTQIFTKDATRPRLVSRLALGPSPDQVPAAPTATISPGQGESAFQDASTLGNAAYLSDLGNPAMRATLPVWYKDHSIACAMVIIPINIKGKTSAIICGEFNDPAHVPPTDTELMLLNTLRSQAILALQQRM